MPRLNSLRAQSVPSALSQGPIDGFLYRQAHVIEPLVKRAVFHPSHLAQLRHGDGSALIGKHPNIATVSGLLGAFNPLAVGRLIVTVVVNTLDGVIVRWSRPNISVKPSEVLSPLLTDGDASSTIVLERFSFAVQAALQNAGPHLVFRTLAHAVDNWARSLLIALPALMRATSNQVPDSVRVEFAAGALADGFQAVRNLNEFDNRPLAEHVPDGYGRQFSFQWALIVSQSLSGETCRA